MTTPFKPYPKYKPSGVEWLGDIPEHWEVDPLFSFGRERKEKNKGMVEDNLLSLSYGKIIRKDITSTDGLLPASFETYQIVRKGDIVFRLTDLQNDKRSLRSALVEEDGIITSAYLAIQPRGPSSNFLNYLYRSYDTCKVFYSMGGGLRQSMKYGEMKRLPSLMPPCQEQSTISTFLDSETAKIDETIKELEASIELLNEEKTSLINEYVTGKINLETGKPYPKYKPSGVEWLGDIPEHWTKEPLRHCINYQEGPGIMAVDFLDEGIPLLRIAGVQGEWATLEGCNYLDPEKVKRKWNHFRLEEGDLLISGSATMGTVTEVNSDTIGAVPYTGLIRLRGEDSKMIKPFIKLIVISSVFMTQIDLLKAGATIQHFGPTHLGQMFVVRPPVSEQEIIATFLKDSCSKVDSLISEKESLIESLKEYRTSLIHEAVTGKIDLRKV